ncbi:hypothetical protein PH210_07850 [Paenibacillus sp. BSR1-1]|uniref:hypothetical protein n=1 Tax=Paenibacillus sp. BSR1-1 TaxID=3020845 RepID=UPI0025AF6596|nr:hypothetical protein [Paenibacillus sp. BSR1-1]MDN3016121.1 hypothetical protein [Paenibacillus sp. BSR1-1]
MAKTTNTQPANKDTNLDQASITNSLDNDNAFSENGLENNRILNKAVNEKKQ